MKSPQRLSMPIGEIVHAGAPIGLAEIKAYFTEKSQAFNVLLPPMGTPFQHQAWRRLGEKDTTIYEVPARQFDNPNAAAFVERGQS